MIVLSPFLARFPEAGARGPDLPKDAASKYRPAARRHPGGELPLLGFRSVRYSLLLHALGSFSPVFLVLTVSLLLCPAVTHGHHYWYTDTIFIFNVPNQLTQIDYLQSFNIVKDLQTELEGRGSHFPALKPGIQHIFS